MNFKELLEQLKGAANELAQSRLMQFGRGNRRYVLAELMPETVTDQNVIREVRLAFENVIAADGARYSPAQKAKLVRGLDVNVELGHQDISVQLTPEDFDAINAAVSGGNSLKAQATALGLVERAILSLVEKNEAQRGAGLAYGEYEVVGAGGLKAKVPFELPDGHRARFESSLADPDFDAMAAFDAMANMLAGAGHPLVRVVASTPTLQQFARNAAVARYIVGENGGLVSIARLREFLSAEYGARLDAYDLRYTAQDGTRHRFLPEGVICLFGSTDDQVSVTFDSETGEDELVLENVVGRTWIGRAAKRSAPGRAVELYEIPGKGGGLIVDAWQTSAVGPTVPAAIGVLSTVESGS